MISLRVVIPSKLETTTLAYSTVGDDDKNKQGLLDYLQHDAEGAANYMGATVVIKDTDCMFVRAMAQLVMRGAQ